MAKKISDIGEFGLIKRIKKTAGSIPKNRRVLLGVGDDAALFKISPGQACAATTDAMVEGVHFDLRYTSFYDLGYKAMAANLSDIAAMGGKPLLALASLSLPSQTSIRAIDQLYAGMKTLAKKHRVVIAGGNIVKSRELSITLTLLGECHPENIGLRSGAKVGDAVLVTGDLGASQAGLDILNSKFKIKNKKIAEKHLRPQSRVREALILADNFKLHGMIDISDGLASELHHLSQSSKVGVIIDQGALPVAAQAIAIGQKLGRDPQKYCLYGGEEYELLFTLPPLEALKAKAMIQKQGTACAIIGQVVKGAQVNIISQNGKTEKLKNQGYTHF
ncbi:thiamine-phosphate kinase [candidate division TA06 bacterium]|uniref:Thiamine-monophosphate kinase n=1 Tax=candidate division TA06 bacterium TaxID=2250710 RepID=A0A933MI27_UNCT6|nr:thiamine-phosphate kinase [candidate division TA06 bacterium]